MHYLFFLLKNRNTRNTHTFSEAKIDVLRYVSRNINGFVNATFYFFNAIFGWPCDLEKTSEIGVADA